MPAQEKRFGLPQVVKLASSRILNRTSVSMIDLSRSSFLLCQLASLPAQSVAIRYLSRFWPSRSFVTPMLIADWIIHDGAKGLLVTYVRALCRYVHLHVRRPSMPSINPSINNQQATIKFPRTRSTALSVACLVETCAQSFPFRTAVVYW